MIKALAKHLMANKNKFYPLSFATGATKVDSWIDIEGGISTLFTYASKGRKEMPDETHYIDGSPEIISKNGTFLGHHIAVPFEGTAIHINAFNFPVWGMLEKIAPSFIENSVRFNMETDSLNFSLLGKDAEPGTAEFDLFVKEVAREMTVKAGQKCTAIRRTLVPEHLTQPVIEALNKRLSKTVIGNPKNETVRMGPLAGKSQVGEVQERVNQLLEVGELVSAPFDAFDVVGAEKNKGAFFPTTLIYCDQPFKYSQPHDIEAFGPVSTIMPYKSTDDAIALTKLGKGSLVGSVFTADNNFAREIAVNTASYHGRLMFINKDSADESTGHGSPLPHLVHGGPGRAGGGEELGGIRSVLHYMQRTAVQGHPSTLTTINNEWYKGAEKFEDVVHPFRKYFDDLRIGETLQTHNRTITEADIVNFSGVSGDNFYAHTDITSLEGTIFEKRVAHGYFIISAATGLFVDPKKGPVLANYGIDQLRFTKPVYAGDTIHVNLTVKEKTKKKNAKTNSFKVL